MIDIKGTSRVIIENVQPQVDQGLYPAKRTPGERVDVTADILSDGHDHIRAVVLYKKEKEKTWQQTEMLLKGNDQWTGFFFVREKADYVFTIKAWVDHFETWYDGFVKKAEAMVDVHVELLEGVAFLKTLAGKKNDVLADAIQKLEGAYESAIDYVLSDDFEILVHQYPLVEHETQYFKELRVVVEHQKANFSAWYELFPRSASLEGNHGTFRDVIRLLPRVASMGFDILYLPPIHPIGKVNRKGKNNTVKAEDGEPGSPWAIGSDEGGHKAIHSELGTLDDYKKLIEECKKHGLAIALDLAFQCAPDHPYVKEHPDWFKQRPDGSIQYAENPPKKYQDIYPFNFETRDWKALWKELKSVITYWIDQGVTVFRVDNPHTKPTPFWQWVIAEVNEEYPDIIFLAEAFTRPRIMASLAKVGFTQSYTYFTWRVTKSELTEYMTELVNGPSRNYFRPNFWPNTPDILTEYLQVGGRSAFMARLILAATLSPNYGIYGPPFEHCWSAPRDPGSEEYLDSEKYQVHYHDLDRPGSLKDFIARVNEIRREHAVLQTIENVRFHPVDNDHLICYTKSAADKSECLLVVVNLDPHHTQAGWVELPLDVLEVDEDHPYQVHDLLSDARYLWNGQKNFVQLDPRVVPAHIFQVRRRVRSERDFEYYL